LNAIISFVTYLRRRPGHCGVCGVPGDLRHADVTMQRFVCDECIDHVIVAHHALARAGIAKPDPQLSERNP
jgi:recombinational DNA repair protein (RecF pathway)